MRKLLVVVSLALAIGLAALGRGASRPVTAVTATWVVDDGGLDCTAGGGSSFTNIHDAVNIVTAGQTIFVCPGNYPEPALIINDANVTLMGPGATPDIDGVATIQVALPGAPSESNMVRIAADGVSVLGLDFDGTLPPAYPVYMTPVGGAGNNLLIADNTFHDIEGGSGSVVIYATTPLDNVQVVRNHAVAESGDIYCQCKNSRIEDNILESSTLNAPAAIVIGDDNVIRGNTAGGYISVTGNRTTIDDNTIDGDGTVTPLVNVHGSNHIVSNNHIMDAVTAGIELSDPGSVDIPTSATITGNTLDSLSVGIRLKDSAPMDNDGETVTAVIGGTPAEGNVFTNSGGSLGDNSYLLELVGIPTPISAENNNWGLCTVGAIEQEILHKPDNSSLGTVDFVPFIATNCPTDTPTPTDSPTPTASPAPSATPSPTATPAPRKWGDFDCDGLVKALDALKLMLGFLELPYEKAAGCPALVSGVQLAVPTLAGWGDVDCSGSFNAQDSLAILTYLVGTYDPPGFGCPSVGDPVSPG